MSKWKKWVKEVLCTLHKSLLVLHFAYESMDLVLLIDMESSLLQITRRGSSFLMPAIAIYLQQSFLTQLHLIRCHVMSMIYEYGLSTSQIRWSGKQVNSLDSKEFICLQYCFLSKVLYLKCWSKFSPTLTFCSDHFVPAQVLWGEQRSTMLLPTQQPLCVRVTNTTRQFFLFLA